VVGPRKKRKKNSRSQERVEGKKRREGGRRKGGAGQLWDRTPKNGLVTWHTCHTTNRATLLNEILKKLKNIYI
jgi:hypothetical protein